MGYGLCMMADFQNALISGIFGVFSNSFLHRTPLNELENGFWNFFWNFNFWAKVRVFHGLWPLHDGRFSKCSHFSNIWYFFEEFFAQNSSKWIEKMVFDMFFGILIFEPKWRFCMGYSLCMMADFQNALISGIFGVFSSSFFCTEQL